MTLQEALADIERQMDTFMTVWIDVETYEMLDKATLGNDQWSGMHRAKCEMRRNNAGKWVYGMRPHHAEEVRDAVRHAIARQVTAKLTQ